MESPFLDKARLVPVGPLGGKPYNQAPSYRSFLIPTRSKNHRTSGSTGFSSYKAFAPEGPLSMVNLFFSTGFLSCQRSRAQDHACVSVKFILYE